MTKNKKPSALKDIPIKKGGAAKYRTSPRNSGKKTYWVVLPEDKEAMWFTSEDEAQEYADSLKGSSIYDMKMYINFKSVETVVRRHNDEFEQKNSKFLWELKKAAGLVWIWKCLS